VLRLAAVVKLAEGVGLVVVLGFGEYAVEGAELVAARLNTLQIAQQLVKVLNAQDPVGWQEAL